MREVPRKLVQNIRVLTDKGSVDYIDDFRDQMKRGEENEQIRKRY